MRDITAVNNWKWAGVCEVTVGRAKVVIALLRSKVQGASSLDTGKEYAD